MQEIHANTYQKGVRNALLEESAPKPEKVSKSVPKLTPSPFRFRGHIQSGLRKNRRSEKTPFSQSAPEQFFTISGAFGARFGEPFWVMLGAIVDFSQNVRNLGNDGFPYGFEGFSKSRAARKASDVGKRGWRKATCFSHLRKEGSIGRFLEIWGSISGTTFAAFR